MVEARIGSENTASIGAASTTSDAPGAGTRLATTTWGGVRSTTIVTAFEVTSCPLLVSWAVTEYVPSPTPLVFQTKDVWGAVTVPIVCGLVAVATIAIGLLVGWVVVTTMVTEPFV